MSRKENIVFERKLLKSKAFRSLSGISRLVYLDFLGKRQVQKGQRRSGRETKWIIINNGLIEYTYAEAENKGITRPRFMHAIDELVAKGFIDVTHSGSGGVKGDKSTYAISDRWRDYGTDSFVFKERPKDTRSGRGWSRYWEKKSQQEVSKKVISLSKRKKLLPKKNIHSRIRLEKKSKHG